MKSILTIMCILNLAYVVKLPELGSNFTASYKQIKTLKSIDGLELESSGNLDVKNASELRLRQLKPFESLTVIKNGEVRTVVNGKSSVDKTKSLAIINNILLALIKADEMKKVIKFVELSFGKNESQILVKEMSENETLFEIYDYKKQK